MGKAEVGTPKYIANKMKAKGLQKLRWYCQMCQKQCRDENGFKCHMTSESHQRQLLLFAENPKRYMGEFSHEFCADFMQLLKRRFGSKRVHANQVYQEYIADRNHVHMNSTHWLSLTGFVKFLGRTGKCIVDETEKGWYITYIDRDPETIAKEEAKAKRLKADRDDEERLLDFVNKQVERNKDKPTTSTEYTEFKRENEEEKIVVNLNTTFAKPEKPASVFTKNILEQVSDDKKKAVAKNDDKKRKRNALDEILAEEEQRKEKMNRKDYWVCEGIVVKVVAKTLGDKYYKKKGYVKSVINKYCAVVVMLENGHTLKVDQKDLETVIPSEGRLVQILNGGYRDCKAVLKSIDEKSFSVSVQIESGPLKGRVINKIPYEDVSKLHPKS